MFLFHRKHFVLPYASGDTHGEDFSTETMNMMDVILSRIGLDDDGLGPNWSSTERIVHKFHMIDVWHRVREVYQEVEQNPPEVTTYNLSEGVHNTLVLKRREVIISLIGIPSRHETAPRTANWFRALKALIMRVRLAILWVPCAMM